MRTNSAQSTFAIGSKEGRVTETPFVGSSWQAARSRAFTIRPAHICTPRTAAARILVNAAGPWAGEVLRRAGLTEHKADIRLIKGSHIVVPRLYDGTQAYILQNDDRRIVFVLPYQSKFNLIGTTDLPFAGDNEVVAINTEEIDYLCRAVSRWLVKPVEPQDVVWSYAGIRPLYDDKERNSSAVTRDYVLDLNAAGGKAPLLSVFGGKITTYRRLAERAHARLRGAGRIYLP